MTLGLEDIVSGAQHAVNIREGVFFLRILPPNGLEYLFGCSLIILKALCFREQEFTFLFLFALALTSSII